MDHLMSQDIKKETFASEPSVHYRPDSFQPRSLQHMDAPLCSNLFTVIPPTPRNPLDARQGPTSDSPFQYSMAQEYSSPSVTSSPWESNGASPDSHGLGTTGPDVAATYPSSLDGSEWDRIRSGNYTTAGVNYSSGGNSYTSMLHNDDNLGSSFGSTGMLGPGYPYTSQGHQEHDALTLTTNFPTGRRMSDATSYSADAIASATDYSYDETASSYDGSTYGTDFTQRTPLSMSATSTPLSPVMSPAPNSVRSMSRGPTRQRTSPSPRVGPYEKIPSRWSYPQAKTPFNHMVDPQLQVQGQFPSNHSSPICPPANPPQQPQYLPSHIHGLQQAPQLFPNSYAGHFYGAPSLGSSPNIHDMGHNAYAEFCEPPDLFGCINEEQIPPPPEDMNPEDPDMKPHEQDLRFDGDLYTPRWVRGHGNKREGWCGICKPGRWLVLKNSAFWYDKSFTHGISAATGLQFHEPRDMRRMDGNPDVWEGLCHSCNEWVPLVSNKKKGTTWFRHAYKCHTHPKIKDQTKRRRESSHGKGRAKTEGMKVDYNNC